MTWTYAGDPAANTTATVRFLVQDTDTNRQLATDEEIAWALTQEHNVYTAAASVLDSIIHRLAGISSKKVGDFSISFDLKDAKERVIRLRNKGRAQYEIPSMPAQSKDDKKALREDTDWVEPVFTKDMHDNVDVNEETEEAK